MEHLHFLQPFQKGSSVKNIFTPWTIIAVLFVIGLASSIYVGDIREQRHEEILASIALLHH